MTTTTNPTALDQYNWKEKLSRHLMHKLLSNLHTGRLIIKDSVGEYEFGQSESNALVKATMTIHEPSAYVDIAFGGSLGAAESYMTGDWDSDHLTDFIRVFALNKDVVDQADSGLKFLTKPIAKFMHWANKNTEKGSRRNIAAHYDLGNDLFKLFLDPTMMYSSAIFTDSNQTLQQAQEARLHRICQKLELTPSDHLVEIGTGWGSMAIYAAKHFGCRVTTTTISREQHDYAKEMIQKEGLEDQITLLFEDYRNLTGKFDKLVSIEMIEAVGHQFYDNYFAKCSSLLKPNGKMLIQAITIDDHRFEQAKNDVDFIKRYIFPGSCIPSITAIQKSISTQTDLTLTHLEDITPHYAETLKRWRQAFQENKQQIMQLGYDNTFFRMWIFYFCYCEGGFAERVIGDVHLMFSKPLDRSTPVLGKLG